MSWTRDRRWPLLPSQAQVGRVGLTLLFVALMPVLLRPSLASDISYVYDDASRLRAVIDPASDTAIYAYL
ncbi:MAG: hypothetical protein JSS39_19460 [Nitrospira sp.]|nr:hypothetical protein [Nitrospira sp.]